MKKAPSVSKVLELILEELQAGRMPDASLIRQGRASLRALSKRMDVAREKAAASGKCGPTRKFDEEKIGMAEGGAAEVAERFGCGVGTVYAARTKMVKAGKRKTQRRRSGDKVE